MIKPSERASAGAPLNISGCVGQLSYKFLCPKMLGTGQGQVHETIAGGQHSTVGLSILQLHHPAASNPESRV